MKRTNSYGISLLKPCFTALITFVLFSTISHATSCCEKGWETVDTKNEPIARHEAAFVEFGGEFYLLGGRRIEPVSIYNPETREWRQGSKPPIEIHHFQPVVVEDKIYMICAMTGRYPTEWGIDKVLTYAPATDTWEYGHTIPEHRRRGSAGLVYVDGKIYVICGIINGHTDGHVKWVDLYDPKTGEWTELDDAPRERDHFQSAYLDGKIYNGGGRRSSFATNQTFELVIPEVDVLDLKTGEWSTLKDPLPTPRAGNSTFALNKDILVAGGESISQDDAHSEVEAWDTVQLKWHNYPSLNRGRHGTGILLHDKYIYTCSGSGHRGGSPELKSLERLPIK